MDKDKIFKEIYNDFFGIENLSKENEKLSKALADLDKEIPEIKVDKSIVEEPVKVEEQTKENKDDKMKDLFNRIEELNITQDSKDSIKKIIEYMRKHEEGIEKRYISFNMVMYSNDDENVLNTAKLIEEAAVYFNYIKNGKIINSSFYNIEKVDELSNLYSSNPSMIIFKDFEAISTSEQSFKDRIVHKLQEKMGECAERTITIAKCKSKDSFAQALPSEVIDKYFDFVLEQSNPDIPTTYEEVLTKIEEGMKIEDELKVELLDYITTTYPNTSLSYTEYRDDICEKILFNKKVPNYEKDKSLDEVFAELNELVGLEKVKKVLRDLTDLIELKSKAKDDLKIKDVNLHMVFLGNPGTGKTTVARIVAEILYNLKYIRQNKLIEVSSKDLVAEYVGQTAPKTMAVIEKAKGGVLFVDEAYSLASGNGQGNSFNDEAIATLIQAMENYRDDLVVIFAGYSKEMQDFLNANSGIVSRIGYTVEFEDYTEDELIKIFEGMLKKSGFEINDDAIEEVRKVIREYKDTENFGNARFVRNVYEKSVIKHASNTKNKKSKKVLKTITKNDISTENLLKM